MDTDVVLAVKRHNDDDVECFSWSKSEVQKLGLRGLRL